MSLKIDLSLFAQELSQDPNAIYVIFPAEDGAKLQTAYIHRLQDGLNKMGVKAIILGDRGLIFKDMSCPEGTAEYCQGWRDAVQAIRKGKS